MFHIFGDRPYVGSVLVSGVICLSANLGCSNWGDATPARSKAGAAQATAQGRDADRDDEFESVATSQQVAVAPNQIPLQQTIPSNLDAQSPQRDWEAVAVLKAYIAEPKWQDRVQYVRLGEASRPRMREVYAENYRPFENKNIRVSPTDPVQIAVGDWITLTADWTDLAYASKGSKEYVMFHTPQGFKVDWEASQGYNEIPLRKFMTTRGEAPASFRVTCELSGAYNHEYQKSAESHYSVLAKSDQIAINGYVAKNSPLGERILNLLRDGKPHMLVLQLQYVGPQGESMRDSPNQGTVAAITDVISESWVLPDPR